MCVAQLVPITIAVLKAVTGWVRKRVKKCKKWPWPLNWLCSFFWVLVLAVVGFVVILITVFITIYVCGWRRTDTATPSENDRGSEAGGVSGVGSAFANRVKRSLFSEKR